MNPLTESPKMFKVRRPDTGQIGYVAENNLDMAISLGGQIIEDTPEQNIKKNHEDTKPERMFKVRRPDTGQIGCQPPR